MYVYIKSEPELWTVGFYKPDGKWEAEKDCREESEAAGRVHWLNGGALRAPDLALTKLHVLEKHLETFNKGTLERNLVTLIEVVRDLVKSR